MGLPNYMYELILATMKMPERSRTSRASQIAQSFCYGLTGHRSNGLAVRVFTDRHTDSSDSMTSTADAGGNKCWLTLI